MSDLTGSTISTTYNLLLTTAETVMGSSLQSIQSGTGVSSALKLSTTAVSVDGSLGVGTDSITAGYALDIEGQTYSRGSGASAAAHINLALVNNAATNAFYINNIGGSETSKLSLNDQVYIEESTGNVGIGGTPDASANLHVFGSNPKLRLQDSDEVSDTVYTDIFNDSGNTYFRSKDGSSNGIFTFNGNNGTTDEEYMRIDSSGNVGIGTASPNIYANYTTLTLNHSSADPDDSLGSLLDMEVNGTHIYELAVEATQATHNVITEHPMVFKTHNTERMRIDSDGAVQLADAARLSLRTTDKTTYISAPSANNMQFVTGDVTRMTIDSSGNVGIGTASETISLPLEVRSEAAVGNGTDGVKLTYSTGNSTGVIDTGYSSTGLELRTGGSPAMRIDSAGQSTFTRTTSGTNVKLELAAARPVLTFNRTTVADDDEVGKINFCGHDSADSEVCFSYIECQAKDVTAGTQDGDLIFGTVANGSGAERMRIEYSGNVGIATADIDGPLDIGFNGGTGTDPYRGGFYFKNSHDAANPNRRVKFDQTTATAFEIQTVNTDETTASDGTIVLQPDGGSVGIGTDSPNANAVLDVASTTMAFMPPRMTTTQRDAISSPTAGMVIYNSTTNVLDFHNGTTWGAV